MKKIIFGRASISVLLGAVLLTFFLLGKSLNTVSACTEEACPSESPCPTPTVDVCDNLDGDQATLPGGMEVDNGFCSCTDGYHEVNSEGYRVAEDGLSDFTCEPDSTPTPESTPGDQCDNVEGFQANVPDNWFQLPDSKICRQFQYGGPPPPPEVSTQGQVLGTSIMAGTGSFDGVLYQAIMGLGAVLTSFGLKKILHKV